MKVLSKIYSGIYFLISTIDKISLVLMLLIIAADVIKRQFGNGLLWGQELATLFFVWFTFLSMAEGVHHKLHISITVVYDRLPRIPKIVVAYFSEIIVGVAGALLVIYGIKIVNTASRVFSSIPFTYKILYIVIPIAGFMICLDSIIFIIKRIMGKAVEVEMNEEELIVKRAKEEMKND